MVLARHVHLCHSAESAWLQKEPGELLSVASDKLRRPASVVPHVDLSRHCLACCLSPAPRYAGTDRYRLKTRQEGQDCSKQLQGQHACSMSTIRVILRTERTSMQRAHLDGYPFTYCCD